MVWYKDNDKSIALDRWGTGVCRSLRAEPPSYSTILVSSMSTIQVHWCFVHVPERENPFVCSRISRLFNIKTITEEEESRIGECGREISITQVTGYKRSIDFCDFLGVW
ncbi:hypothetical protein L873DRAFT_284471 [Choiromyces venosus 120613-1]|uniref:Uncharacterized protein n=1 Tax=Choiromyces venosus 120613-1 TaxID=1336337 RepID=A0A3N4JY61_9PEZI|nr:hypothetical protein L873DRAFT_284471 [Choiromyces venosus 120613-1]